MDTFRPQRISSHRESTMATSKIQELALKILTNTIKFDQSLEPHNLSASFDVSTFQAIPESPQLQAAQTAIIDATTELQALVLGPITMLRSIALKVRGAYMTELKPMLTFKLRSTLTSSASKLFTSLALPSLSLKKQRMQRSRENVG